MKFCMHILIGMGSIWLVLGVQRAKNESKNAFSTTFRVAPLPDVPPPVSPSHSYYDYPPPPMPPPPSPSINKVGFGMLIILCRRPCKPSKSCIRRYPMQCGLLFIIISRWFESILMSSCDLKSCVCLAQVLFILLHKSLYCTYSNCTVLIYTVMLHGTIDSTLQLYNCTNVQSVTLR